MPGNLRYGLTSGLSTASKKRRPGSRYLESPFFTFQTRTRIVHPFHFISRLGFDSAPSRRRKQAPGQRRGASAQIPESSPGGCEGGFFIFPAHGQILIPKLSRGHTRDRAALSG